MSLNVSAANNVSCNGGTDGIATAVASGGTPTYGFQWSASAGSQTTATANNLQAGTHTVIVTDANGCIITGSVTITEPSALSLTTAVGANVSCNGGSDGQATITVTGGTPDATGNYQYQWSTSAGNQITATANNLPAGPAGKLLAVAVIWLPALVLHWY